MTISSNLMGALAPLPVLIPMLGAAATLVVGRRPRFQRVFGAVFQPAGDQHHVGPQSGQRLHLLLDPGAVARPGRVVQRHDL